MAKKKREKVESGDFLVCRNPKATRGYDIEERLEVGLSLVGSEVKSLRARRADLEGAYASVTGEELFLHKMHIAPYEQAGHFGHDPKRTRKLLAHKAEIRRLGGRLTQRGYTLIPLSVYFKGRRAKVELGLGKGRKVHDDREAIKRKLDVKEARAAMTRARGGGR